MISAKLKSVVSQWMYQEKQWRLGKKDFLKFYTDIELTISGIWMKPGAFGVHFQSMGLEKRGHCVREVRRQNSNLSCKKNNPLLLSGKLKSLSVLKVMSKLPVHYFSQSNAWMTGEILDSVLTG